MWEFNAASAKQRAQQSLMVQDAHAGRQPTMMQQPCMRMASGISARTRFARSTLHARAPSARKPPPLQLLLQETRRRRPSQLSPVQQLQICSLDIETCVLVVACSTAAAPRDSDLNAAETSALLGAVVEIEDTHSQQSNKRKKKNSRRALHSSELSSSSGSESEESCRPKQKKKPS
eukprot:1198929-Pleurochrysis_carterae.AAC.3